MTAKISRSLPPQQSRLDMVATCAGDLSGFKHKPRDEPTISPYFAAAASQSVQLKTAPNAAGQRKTGRLPERASHTVVKSQVL